MAFKSPNHTQAPNDLFDKLMREMGEAELKVTLAVIRGTLGYHKEKITMSISKMAEMTGLSENGVIAGAKQAEKRGTIKKINKGLKSTAWRVRFSASASEVRKKRHTSASEVGIPQPVRYSTSVSEVQLGLNKDKEIKKEKRSRETPPRDPALLITSIPHGPELFSELSKAYESLNRKPPTYFKTTQQAEAFTATMTALNSQAVPMIQKGLSRERLSLSALLAWLEACNRNRQNPNPAYQPRGSTGAGLGMNSISQKMAAIQKARAEADPK